jgi:hypothetical protein
VLFHYQLVHRRATRPDSPDLGSRRVQGGIRAGVADRDSDAVETAIRRLAAAPVTVALEDAGAERVL